MDNFIDSIGYYQIGDKKFHEKIDACLNSNINELHCNELHWYLHETSYSKYNWKIEPTENLDELYKNRAMELRNKYDYIILMLSGGIDSQNILDVFLRNNIKIDKIMSWIDTGTKNYKHNPANIEIFKNTIPFLQNLKKQFELPDYSFIDLKDIWPKMNDMKWMEHTSAGYVNVHRGFSQFFDEIDIIKKQIDKGKKIAWIRGMAKPYVDFNDAKWFVRFNDASSMGVHFPSFCKHIEKKFYNEWFYWGESCAPLICKQAHTIKKYFEKNFEIQNFKNIYDLLTQVALENKVNYTFFNNNYNGHINPLIYKNFTQQYIMKNKPKYFTLGKSGNINIELKCNVFFENHNKNLADAWFKEGERLNQLLDKKFIKNGGHFIHDGMINGWSKKYFLN